MTPSNYLCLCIHISLVDSVFVKGSFYEGYDEAKVKEYMKNESLNITIELGLGNKNFTAYTMDLTKKYIEINADYRS